MRWLIALALLAQAAPALAHGAVPGPGWSLDPGIALPLVAALFLYSAGWWRLIGRATSSRHRLRREGMMFLAGWSILALALLSPLHEGGERSFTLHMIEHELIMLPAALLIVLARPGVALLWSLPRRSRQLLAPLVRLSLWRKMAEPFTATGIQAVVIILWHLPGAFELALEKEGWHIIQHLSFLLSALLFWHAMMDSKDARGALCLFVTSLVGGGLGALMALSPQAWYPAYARLLDMPLGLTPEEDQQLAGMIMWVPGGMFHLAAALLLLLRAIRAQPQKFSTTA